MPQTTKSVDARSALECVKYVSGVCVMSGMCVRVRAHACETWMCAFVMQTRVLYLNRGVASFAVGAKESCIAPFAVGTVIFMNKRTSSKRLLAKIAFEAFGMPRLQGMRAYLNFAIEEHKHTKTTHLPNCLDSLPLNCLTTRVTTHVCLCCLTK